MFWIPWILFFLVNLFVLFTLRKHPIYEPRVLFSLSSLLWLVAAYGYIVEFEGFLAAKLHFYNESMNVLVVKAMLLFLIGYLGFILGASFRPYSIQNKLLFYKYSTIKLVVFILAFLAISNFYLNVLLISNGNVVDYLVSTAGRIYQIKDGKGISAVGYLFGFIPQGNHL